ncbi:MAG: hypothetical protein V4694_01475 [Pseudomonadota bacterium]
MTNAKKQKNVSFNPEVQNEKKSEPLKTEYKESWKKRHQVLLDRTEFSAEYLDLQTQYAKITKELRQENKAEDHKRFEEETKNEPKIKLSRNKTYNNLTGINQTPNAETSPNCFYRLCTTIVSLFNK